VKTVFIQAYALCKCLLCAISRVAELVGVGSEVQAEQKLFFLCITKSIDLPFGSEHAKAASQITVPLWECHGLQPNPVSGFSST